MSSIGPTTALTLPGRPGSATWRGLTLSSTGGPYVVQRIETGIGFEALRAADRDRPLGDGAIAGADYLPGQTIRALLGIADGPGVPLGPLVDALVGSFRPSRSTEDPLVFWRPGDAAPRVWFVRPRRIVVPPATYWTGAGLDPEVPVEWFAPDPRRYSTAVRSVTLTPDAGALPGRSYDLTFDRSYGGGAVGLRTAVNAGSVPTFPRITLYGGLVDPFVENVSTGETITLTGTITAGTVIVIDPQEHTITEAGVSRYSLLDGPPDWFDLEPGPNDVRLGAASSTGGYAVVEWRDAN